MITLTIDNKKITAKKGLTVLQAAQQSNIEIPNLCSHEELEPYGGCRLCVVQIEGMRGFPTSCTTPATDGMVVKTKTPEVVELRRNIFKLLMSGHTSPCLVCPHREPCEKYRPNPSKAGKTVKCESCNNRDGCKVRDLSKELEIEGFELPVIYNNIPLERNDPFMDRDYNLCILCGKCVRICKKIHGRAPFDFIKRGQDSRIGTAFFRDHTETECNFCGACIDICPTGTLSDRHAKWRGKPDRTEEITCDLCPVACKVILSFKDGKAFTAEPTALSNEARLCALGRFVLPLVYESPDHKAAAVDKLAGLSKGRLIPNIILDIEKRIKPLNKKADIISALKSIPKKEKAEKKPEEIKVKEDGKPFKIVYKEELVPNTHMLTIHAPSIAAKCQPGQFVIGMANELSERVPYTIADWDAREGTVTINVQEKGRSSREMILLEQGDSLAHFAGPLGMPVEIKKYGTVVCGGGCFGVGAILPIARALKEAGNKVICIEEASSSYLLYWQDKLAAHCDEFLIATKDGSFGTKGGVQEVIALLKKNGEKIDQAFISGCAFMMMLCSETTKGLNIPTLVALNSIMIDGTGMCGACRVSVGDTTKFVCVDGPFLDGHLVNWIELLQRRSAYTKIEVDALSQDELVAKHPCRTI